MTHELTDGLHAAIMNLPCNELHAGSSSQEVQRAYGKGHRDARHAAAETVLAHLAQRGTSEALHDAATSLETIASLAGRKTYGDPPIETYMDTFMDVRMYAAARAKVAREALAASPQAVQPMPDGVPATPEWSDADERLYQRTRGVPASDDAQQKGGA